MQLLVSDALFVVTPRLATIVCCSLFGKKLVLVQCPSIQVDTFANSARNDLDRGTKVPFLARWKVISKAPSHRHRGNRGRRHYRCRSHPSFRVVLPGTSVAKASRGQLRPGRQEDGPSSWASRAKTGNAHAWSCTLLDGRRGF
jgi:hypothetical protein